MNMKKVAQLLVVIVVAGLSTGCGEEPCTSGVCRKIVVKKAPCQAKSEAPTAKPAASAPVEEPKAEQSTAKEPSKATANEKGKLIIVTNEVNYELDKDVINFIATRGVPIERVSPVDFGKYKGEKYILVLGGPNDDEGLGDIVKEVLSTDEVNYVNQMGNRKLYLKTNKWSGDQYVLVIAGYDADATFRELVNGKDKWWGYISSWFNIELSHDEVYGY
jgi:cellobiose-specific phosphotransferase system component IIB